MLLTVQLSLAAGDVPKLNPTTTPSATEGVPLGPDGRIHVPGDALVAALLTGASAQVRLGAERYHLVCAACHGSSGLGLAEGRLMFPDSHRRCERCHRPSNPARLPEAAIAPRNAFSIGDPPVLRGPDLQDAFPTGNALYAYVRAAMPRYHPGLLGDEESLAVTAFLMVLNHSLPASATITAEEARRLPLAPAGD